MMKILYTNIILIILLFAVTATANAGPVTSTFAAGDTLSASKMTEIKDAINDNNAAKHNPIAGTCPSGQLVSGIVNGTINCAADIDTDTNTTYTAGAGLTLTGTIFTATSTDTLAGLTCGNGQVAKWNGSAWACAADVDTDTNTDTLAGLTCSSGQVAKWNGTAWVCADDTNTDSAGVAFASSTVDFQISTTTSTIQSVTLTAPGPGQVVVSFSAYYRMLHATGIADQIEVGIAELASAVVGNLSSRRFLFLDTGFASGNFFGSVASHAVFTVPSAGTYIYYVLGVSNKATASASFTVSFPATQAVFVPNSY